MSDPCETLANPPANLSQSRRDILESLCSCKEASDALTAATQAHTAAYKTWSDGHQDYLARHSEWQGKRGRYAQFANYNHNEAFQGSHCFNRPDSSVCHGTVAAGTYTNDKCAAEAAAKRRPYASEYIDTGGRASCGANGFNSPCFYVGGTRGQSVSCGRSPDKLQQAKTNYENAIPKDVGPAPVNNTNIVVQCCSNYMAGDNSTENEQSCKNEITSQTIRAIEGPEPAGGSGAGSGDGQEPGTANKFALPAMLSVSLCSCIIFICICILIMMSSSGDVTEVL